MKMAANFNQILIVDSLPEGELNTAVRLFADAQDWARAIGGVPHIASVRVPSSLLIIQRLLLALALASASVMVYAHAPATDSAEVHGKKPGFFKRLFHRHKDAPQWDGVQPELRSTLERSALQMKGEGCGLRLMEGYRSEQRQAALLASQKGA